MILEVANILYSALGVKESKKKISVTRGVEDPLTFYALFHGHIHVASEGGFAVVPAENPKGDYPLRPMGHVMGIPFVAYIPAGSKSVSTALILYNDEVFRAVGQRAKGGKKRGAEEITFVTARDRSAEDALKELVGIYEEYYAKAYSIIKRAIEERPERAVSPLIQDLFEEYAERTRDLAHKELKIPAKASKVDELVVGEAAKARLIAHGYGHALYAFRDSVVYYGPFGRHKGTNIDYDVVRTKNAILSFTPHGIVAVYSSRANAYSVYDVLEDAELLSGIKVLRSVIAAHKFDGYVTVVLSGRDGYRYYFFRNGEKELEIKLRKFVPISPAFDDGKIAAIDRKSGLPRIIGIEELSEPEKRIRGALRLSHPARIELYDTSEEAIVTVSSEGTVYAIKGDSSAALSPTHSVYMPQTAVVDGRKMALISGVGRLALYAAFESELGLKRALSSFLSKVLAF